MLPQVEQGPLFNSFNSALGMEGPTTPLPLGFFANSTVFGTKLSMFQCPSDNSNQFQITPQYLGGALSGPISTKGNYAASWGNTYWGQDQPATTATTAPMRDPITGLVPVFQRSAFGFYTVGIQSITDGSSNTVMCAEVLQGELYDVRGLLWSTIPGGSSFFSRMPPNNPVDYYQTGFFGDQLNRAIFCVNEPGMDLPCSATPDPDVEAYAGSRSRHPGGLNVLNGDGSVRFLKNSINMPVWLGLTTIRGGEVISSDAWQ